VEYQKSTIFIGLEDKDFGVDFSVEVPNEELQTENNAALPTIHTEAVETERNPMINLKPGLVDNDKMKLALADGGIFLDQNSPS
jgi:hypothetical protein